MTTMATMGIMMMVMAYAAPELWPLSSLSHTWLGNTYKSLCSVCACISGAPAYEESIRRATTDCQPQQKRYPSLVLFCAALVHSYICEKSPRRRFRLRHLAPDPPLSRLLSHHQQKE
ncbi:hypothetical protein HDV64DRAFT_252671 [Trichoderma sp. TUCIM 5745]